MLLRKPEAAFIGKMFVAMLWVAVLAIVLVGCSLIAPAAGPELARAVKHYCAEPAAQRELLRAAINAQIAPHQVELGCASDALPPAGLVPPAGPVPPAPGKQTGVRALRIQTARTPVDRAHCSEVRAGSGNADSSRSRRC